MLVTIVMQTIVVEIGHQRYDNWKTTSAQRRHFVRPSTWPSTVCRFNWKLAHRLLLPRRIFKL